MMLFILVFVGQARTQDIVNKAFYYYSEEASAFVIGTTENSELRVFAEYELPSSCFDYDSCNVYGPGFSPSKKWFSWMFDNNAARPSVDAQAHVVNVNTGRQQILLDGDGGIRHLSWSPTDDLLLVERFNFAAGNTTYFVWDINTTRELFTYPEKVIVEWTPDGRLVTYLPLSDDGPPQIIITDTFGEVFMKHSVSGLWEQSQSYACKPFWSPTGHLMFVNESAQLTVAYSAHRQEFSLRFQDTYLIRVEWSADNNYALIFSSDQCAPITSSTVTNLWLLSYPNQELTFLSDAATPPFHVSLPALQKHSWSPATNDFFYVTTQNNTKKLIVASLPALVSHDVYADTEIRPEQTEWLHNGQLAFYGLSTGGDASIYVFDSQKRMTHQLVSGKIVNQNFDFSPNEALIVFDNISVCNGICLFDVEANTHTAFEFLRDPDSGGSGSVEEFLWHPNGDLLLVTGSRVGSSRQINVMNVETFTHRALDGWFVLSPASFGWFD